MNFRTPLTIAAAAALALSLGAASLPGATAAKAPAAHNACFWAHDVDSFSALPDERTVYLRVGVRRYFELTLFAPCLDIDWTHHIALVARGGDWICEGNGLDAEIISHATGLGRQRCQVTRVRKLTAEEVAAIPKKYVP